MFYCGVLFVCQQAAYYAFLLHDDISHIHNSLQAFTSVGNLQTKTVMHGRSITNFSDKTRLVKASVASATNCCGEEKKSNKNRWVSTERNDGMAMGAVCDWSIPSPSKPFFSLRHVLSVDKRHHPTDSLINCEMYSYLPLSYSRACKTPPPSTCYLLHLPACK